MRERQWLDDQISGVERLEAELSEQTELIELGEAESDADVVAEAEAALKTLHGAVERRQVETMLSGEADGNDAFLEVHAGAGGTESQDWAAMLMRMYTRWAEQSEYKVQLLEIHDGKTSSLKFRGLVFLFENNLLFLLLHLFFYLKFYGFDRGSFIAVGKIA
jgi:peptide chain release factor 2